MATFQKLLLSTWFEVENTLLYCVIQDESVRRDETHRLEFLDRLYASSEQSFSQSPYKWLDGRNSTIAHLYMFFDTCAYCTCSSRNRLEAVRLPDDVLADRIKGGYLLNVSSCWEIANKILLLVQFSTTNTLLHAETMDYVFWQKEKKRFFVFIFN